jgi:cbb3-type cytochrome oxidase subunit 1
MEWFVRWFIRSALVWFGLGITLGLCMAAHPAWIIYRPAHVHMNLVGFVTMMIFGVAYHVIPRFTGHQLHSRAIAGWQWWLANIGLAGMVAGFVLQPHIGARGMMVLVAGGTLEAISAYLFVYNIWRTIGPAPRPLPQPPLPQRPLPTRS